MVSSAKHYALRVSSCSILLLNTNRTSSLIFSLNSPTNQTLHTVCNAQIFDLLKYVVHHHTLSFDIFYRQSIILTKYTNWSIKFLWMFSMLYVAITYCECDRWYRIIFWKGGECIKLGNYYYSSGMKWVARNVQNSINLMGDERIYLIYRSDNTKLVAAFAPPFALVELWGSQPIKNALRPPKLLFIRLLAMTGKPRMIDNKRNIVVNVVFSIMQ